MTNLRIEDDRKQLPANPAATRYASRAPRPTAHTVSAANRLERSEGDLIARIKGGDVEGFYELVRPYERAVFLAALSLVKNDADAEEVAQEAILKAFKNLSRFREEAKFSTWLIQISINEAKMKLRKDRRTCTSQWKRVNKTMRVITSPRISQIGGTSHRRRWSRKNFVRR